MTQEIKGSCLCGKVQFTVNGPFERFYLCHCGRCRKGTGSAHASNIFTQPENIVWIAGEDLVKRFELPNAIRFTRAFCTHCGGPVPVAPRKGKFLVIPAGTLDEDPPLSPQSNIFWADRASWYEKGLVAQRFEAYPI
ncbi:MAG TPA: GFA family protein [Acidiferrobacteraceae bacterium]|nr:GFA family protein [Acidiferrobacteraceae bacterium]